MPTQIRRMPGHPEAVTAWASLRCAVSLDRTEGIEIPVGFPSLMGAQQAAFSLALLLERDIAQFLMSTSLRQPEVDIAHHGTFHPERKATYLPNEKAERSELLFISKVLCKGGSALGSTELRRS